MRSSSALCKAFLDAAYTTESIFSSTLTGPIFRFLFYFFFFFRGSAPVSHQHSAGDTIRDDDAAGNDGSKTSSGEYEEKQNRNLSLNRNDGDVGESQVFELLSIKRNFCLAAHYWIFFFLVLFHSLLWYLLSFLFTTQIIGASFETITFHSHKRAISIFYLVYFPCKAFLTVSFLFFFFLTLLNFSHSNVIKFCGV